MNLDTQDEPTCPHCGNDDITQLELTTSVPAKSLFYYHCCICSKDFMRVDGDRASLGKEDG